MTVVLVNCFENIVIATQNSRLNSTYLLTNEKRWETERKERQRERIIRRRASEEDRQREVSMLHLEA